MKVILDHIDGTVRPVLRKYAAAEKGLTAANKAIRPKSHGRRHAGGDAGGTASRRRPASPFRFRPERAGAAASRVPGCGAGARRLRPHCVFLRVSTLPIDDISLLRDVAEAFKHHKPARPSITVASSQHIITIASGWGELRYGEGKNGGDEQVLVIRKDGEKRALSSILQDAFDAC